MPEWRENLTVDETIENLREAVALHLDGEAPLVSARESVRRWS